MDTIGLSSPPANAQLFQFDYGKAVFDLNIDGDSFRLAELIHSLEQPKAKFWLKCGKTRSRTQSNTELRSWLRRVEMKVTIETITIEGPLGDQNKVSSPNTLGTFPKVLLQNSLDEQSAYVREIVRALPIVSPKTAWQNVVNRLAAFAELAIEEEANL